MTITLTYLGEGVLNEFGDDGFVQLHTREEYLSFLKGFVDSNTNKIMKNSRDIWISEVLRYENAIRDENIHIYDPNNLANIPRVHEHN